MNKILQNFLYLISHPLFAFLLNACDGDVLFRTKPCEDGMVRQGSACVEPTKAGMGECKDVDLNKVQKGETVTMCNGSMGEGKLVIPSECQKDGEQDCVNKIKFKAVNTDSLSSSDIKNGKVVAGIIGSLRPYKQCRNYSNISTFDTSYPPSNLGWNTTTFAPVAVSTASNQIDFVARHGFVTNSPLRFSTTNTLPAPLVAGTIYYVIYVSDTIFQLASTVNGAQIDITSQGTGTHSINPVGDNTSQYFDTIDDHNYGQAFTPANNPWSSSDYLCDASSFVNVTTSSAPFLPSGLTSTTGNQPFTQIWQDQISGMYFSNILSVAGGRTWSHAVRTCESLNGGSAGDGWRLPTQKELMLFHINGISKVSLAGGSTNVNFWSSSGSSDSTGEAWIVNLANGLTYTANRIDTSLSVLCTR